MTALTLHVARPAAAVRPARRQRALVPQATQQQERPQGPTCERKVKQASRIPSPEEDREVVSAWWAGDMWAALSWRGRPAALPTFALASGALHHGLGEL